jgi:hypothetical protein
VINILKDVFEARGGFSEGADALFLYGEAWPIFLDRLGENIAFGPVRGIGIAADASPSPGGVLG